MMKHLLPLISLLLLPLSGFAAGGHSVDLDNANIDLTNKASLQRGAKYFTNYCLSCHSASYSRYNRVGQDLGLTEDQVKDNLIFTTNEKGEQTKVGSLMTVAMSKDYGKEAFGAAPPDLTVIARSRGVDWLYTYMRTFYIDESRPLGMNNLVYPNVGMPHVMWDLQGLQKKVYKEVEDHGEVTKVFSHFEIVEPGKMSPDEYDLAVRDLVNFLAYMGEPAQLERKKVGVYVLLFLAILFVFAYYMKKEYWKDIH